LWRGNKYNQITAYDRFPMGTVPFLSPFPCSINPTFNFEMTMRKLRLRGMSNAYETYGS